MNQNTTRLGIKDNRDEMIEKGVRRCVKRTRQQYGSLVKIWRKEKERDSLAIIDCTMLLNCYRGITKI